MLLPGEHVKKVFSQRFENFKSEVELDSVVLFNSRSKVSSDVGANRGKKDNLVRNAAGMRGRSTDRQPLKPKDSSASYWQVPNGEDGISAGSFLEAEEKTIKAVCEQMKVIQRNNTTSIACTNVTDIPPDLVNPGAVELVLDIRREYATKFEEVIHLSLRSLRSIAVKEQRCQSA